MFVVLGAGRWSGRERECGPQVAPVHVFCSNGFCVASVATADRSLASLTRVFAANRARSTTASLVLHQQSVKVLHLKELLRIVAQL